MRSRYDINKIHLNYMDTSYGRTRITIDRPSIDYRKAIMRVILVAMLSVICVPCIGWIIDRIFETSQRMLFSVLLVLLFDIIIFGRWIAIWFVTVYQNKAKIETRMKCCCEPSCSEYAILAFEKYGLVYGGTKAIKRMRRCRPPGKIDYP